MVDHHFAGLHHDLDAAAFAHDQRPHIQQKRMIRHTMKNSRGRSTLAAILLAGLATGCGSRTMLEQSRVPETPSISVVFHQDSVDVFLGLNYGSCVGYCYRRVDSALTFTAKLVLDSAHSASALVLPKGAFPPVDSIPGLIPRLDGSEEVWRDFYGNPCVFIRLHATRQANGDITGTYAHQTDCHGGAAIGHLGH